MRRTPLALATAALTLAAAGAAQAAPLAPAGLTLSAGGGCAIQCVTAATVVPTATTATLDVTTSVPASITARAVPAGQVAGPAPHPSVPLPATRRTIDLAGLTPSTEYDITVRATDLQGRTSTRSGRFRTADPAPRVDVAPDLAPGAGCAADCIERGVAIAHPDIPGRVDLDVRTTSPARITLTVTRTKDGTTTTVKSLQSPAGATAFAPALTGLRYGTRYGVRVEASDGNGTRVETGAFTTRRVDAIVTYRTIQIIKDGDRIGRGDFSFFYDFGEKGFDWGHRKASDGDVFAAPVNEGRPSPAKLLPLPADGAIHLRVSAEEHDGLSWDNHESATAEVKTTVKGLMAPTALPPWYGTGVTMPAGHDAYAVFATPPGPVRFRVFATVDLHVR
jgi:hypothetical protein